MEPTKDLDLYVVCLFLWINVANELEFISSEYSIHYRDGSGWSRQFGDISQPPSEAVSDLNGDYAKEDSIYVHRGLGLCVPVSG